MFDDFSKPENMKKYDDFWEDLKDMMNQIQEEVSVSVETSDIARFNELNTGRAFRFKIIPPTSSKLPRKHMN